VRGSGGLGTGVGLGWGVRVGVTHEEGPRVQGEGGESGEEMRDGGTGMGMPWCSERWSRSSIHRRRWRATVWEISVVRRWHCCEMMLAMYSFRVKKLGLMSWISSMVRGRRKWSVREFGWYLTCPMGDAEKKSVW
jgi:hypothetical protein